MDKDRVEGAARNTGGKIKEAAGKVLGDEKLKREGQADRVAGKVQNVVGGIKDSLHQSDDDHDRKVVRNDSCFVRFRKSKRVDSMKLRKITTLVAGLTFVGLAACTPTRTQKSAGEAIDDGVITTRVKAELARDSRTSALHTNVETFRGTVQLNGFVASADEKAEAARVARGVPGVQRVDNNLKVECDEKRSTGEFVDDR